MKMVEYEEHRLRRIEENKRKMEELNLKPLAYEAVGSMRGKKPKMNKKLKSKQVFANDDEYRPDEEGDHLEQSTEDDDIEGLQTRTSFRLCSKKVMASARENLQKSIEKPQFSTASMASFVKTRSQIHEKNLHQGKDKKQQDVNSLQMRQQEKVIPTLVQTVHPKQSGGTSSQTILQRNTSMTREKNLPRQSQQTIENNTNIKKGHGVTVVAPGTLGLFVRMKEKSKENEQLSKQIDAFDQPMKNSRKQQTNYLGVQLFEDDSSCRFDLVNEEEGYQSLDDYTVEEEQNTDVILQRTNESVPTQDQPTDQLGKVSQKEKRTRGPTTCKEVHGWTINDRKPIILNEMGQPIGPDNKTLRQFSQFCGSLARDSTLAPLNWHDWRYVPDKDNIWDYVKKKFMISEEGKDYVLSSIGTLWRSYKSRLKKKHYFNYTNERDIWKNRPKSVPDAHFKDLLQYWDLEEVQGKSDKNKEHSEAQKDRHTMGTISFARKRHELEQVKNKPPSKATMYKETRKRTEGRKYKTSYMEKMPESGKTRLLGRCTKKENRPSKSGVLIPDEVLQPYKAEIVKETLGEVVKFLKDQIPSEMLASLASSLNGQSFGLTNDKEQCQDDAQGHDATNDDVVDDDVEGNKERIENEDGYHEDN